MIYRGVESRAHKRRHSLMTTVKVYDDNGPLYCFVRDLGQGGMSVFGLRPLEVGRTYRIEFTHPELGITVGCHATIKWSRMHNQGFVCVTRQGLMFEDIDTHSAKRLDEWACESPGWSQSLHQDADR